MELDEWAPNLPRTAAKWREGRIEEIEEALCDDLTVYAAELAGEACANSGGWSDDEEVTILKLHVHEDQLDANLRINFVELRPSGCSDSPHRDQRAVEFLLTMQRDEDWGVVSHSPSNPEQWDLEDRNSAFDGT